MVDNMQKYLNYKEQMGRLTKAMNSGFYIEAIAIEYAIMEDRLESIMRHSGKLTENNCKSISKKLSVVESLQREKANGKKKVLLRKYISEELIESIKKWKEARNAIIHALLKQNLHTENLQELAEEGRDIVKTLNNKVSSYNRAVDKQNKENQGEN